MLKLMALGLFGNSRCRSIHGYLVAHDMEFLYNSLRRFINSSQRLKFIFLGRRRLDPQLAVEARRIIYQHFAPEDIESNETSGADDTRTIFDFQQLKRIAEGLDFNARPRMTRDGTKEIAVHKKINSSEHVKMLIFLLANKVMAQSNLRDAEDRKKVLEYASIVIFYDHGYSSVRGAGELDRTWDRRLRAAFTSGADTNPLKARHKGKTSY